MYKILFPSPFPVPRWACAAPAPVEAEQPPRVRDGAVRGRVRPARVPQLHRALGAAARRQNVLLVLIPLDLEN